MILCEASREEYLRTTYAAWLGKVIGVRLGAPVENWSHERIMETYGNREGYLTDYGIFAADDDTNGPLFFVRALLEKDSITAADIGDAFLNYIPEYHGFFWWGGVGVSTEHTAYENLKNGIKAPRSGSREQNGLTIANRSAGRFSVTAGAMWPGLTRNGPGSWRRWPVLSPMTQTASRAVFLSRWPLPWPIRSRISTNCWPKP